MLRFRIITLLVILSIAFANFTLNKGIDGDWDENAKVAEVLGVLGEDQPLHSMQYSAQQVKKGEEIVKKGYTTAPNGRKTSLVSKHFKCTHCHNLEREDPDLRKSDPEARLRYAIQRELPFLQGTTFKGIVNRESWYNDDYVKKYGDAMVQKAHKSLRQSIQLCAIQCSQGRYLEPWEIDAILAYYWSLEFSLKDLKLTEAELDHLNKENRDPTRQKELINWLKGFYLQKSPAHFFDGPPDKSKGYEGIKGDAGKGKYLYEQSCLHCHNPEGVSCYVLDHSKLSFRHLKQMIPKDSHFSLYQIVAYGTYALPGHRPYMPHYPLERMNKQQVEDLRAYIEKQAF